jgi:hypothetical protein
VEVQVIGFVTLLVRVRMLLAVATCCLAWTPASTSIWCDVADNTPMGLAKHNMV